MNRAPKELPHLATLQLQEKLILASSSPRRAEILTNTGWPFEVRIAGVDESVREDEEPSKYVERLALAKAQKVAAEVDSAIVLGADTTVVVNSEILLQPENDDDAKRMLRLLSGQWHEVLTGVALVTSNRHVVAHRRTQLKFASLSAEDIDWYVATGEPRGKAGAYAVQGRAALFIEEIRGDYYNVVGLPIRLVYELLLGLGDLER